MEELEKRILASLLRERKVFNTAQSIVSATDFSELGKLLYKETVAYYEADIQADSVDRVIISQRCNRKYGNQGAFLTELIESLYTLSETISPVNILNEVFELKKKSKQIEIANLLYGEAQDNQIEAYINEYREIVNQHEKLIRGDIDENERGLCDVNADYFTKRSKLVGKMRLVPGSLHKHVGHVSPGDHIVIMARVNVGKTLFALNMAAGFLSQGFKVVYAGNEESDINIYLRFLSRLNEKPYQRDIFEKPEELQKAIESAREMGYNRLAVEPLHGGNESDLITLIEKHDPDVLFVDQILNMRPGKADSDAENISAASKIMRGLGKHYNKVMVSVCQAGAQADNKLVLGMSDLFQSKTSVPGDADLLIGLGSNQDFLAQKRIMVNIIKNKLNDIYHGYFPVNIDRTINKVKSI